MAPTQLDQKLNASSNRVAKQLQPRPVRYTRRDEAGGGGAEHELERVAGLPAHAQATPLLEDSDDRAGFEVAAEVGDACAGAHARDGSRGAEHCWMVGPGEGPG